jgi:hypothetical protein
VGSVSSFKGGKEKTANVAKILGRKPSAFEMQLLEDNSKYAARIASYVSVKLFLESDCDATGSYPCMELLVQVSKGYGDRFEALAKANGFTLSEMARICLETGLVGGESLQSTKDAD